MRRSLQGARRAAGREGRVIVPTSFVVRGRYHKSCIGRWPIVACVSVAIAGGIVLLGECIGPDEMPFGLILLGAFFMSAPFFLLLGYVPLRAVCRRWRVERDGEESVTITERGKAPVQIRFSELGGFSDEAVRQFDGRTQTGTWHTIRLWHHRDPADEPSVSVFWRIDDKQPEGMAAGVQWLVDRARDVIEERMEHAYGLDRTVGSPELLLLEKHRLRYQGAALKLAEIETIEEHDRHFNVWKRGDPTPAMQIPVRLANAEVIMALTRRRLAGLPSPKGDTGPLGKLLFTREQPNDRELLYLALGFLLLPFGVGLYFLYLLLPGKLKPRRLRFYENGVARSVGDGRPTEVLFSQLAALGFGVARVYESGNYAGTTTGIHLVPERSTGLPHIRYATGWSDNQEADEDILKVQERATPVVAERLMRQLAETGTCPWTKGLELTRTGVRYRPRSIFGGRAWQELPYTKITRTQFVEGRFELIQGQRVVFHCPARELNLLPGLHALASIRSGMRSSGPRPVNPADLGEKRAIHMA